MNLWIFLLVLFLLLATLLSYGLERQRRELAGLRREIEDWVAMDLKLKRQRLGLGLQTDFDPKRWVSRLVGTEVQSLEAESAGGGFWAHTATARYFISPLSRRALRARLQRNGRRLKEPVVLGNLPQALKARQVRRISIAEDVLLDLAYAETVRSLGMTPEEPHQVFVYSIPREKV